MGQQMAEQAHKTKVCPRNALSQRLVRRYHECLDNVSSLGVPDVHQRVSSPREQVLAAVEETPTGEADAVLGRGRSALNKSTVSRPQGYRYVQILLQ